MWKKLRDGYRSSKKRKASGSAASSTNRWKYELQMSFLQPFMKDRARMTNSEESQAEEMQNYSVSLQDAAATETHLQPSSEEDSVPLPTSSPQLKCSITPGAKKKEKSVLQFLQHEAKKKDERVNRREEMRRTLLQPDNPLKSFFDSMYGSTKSLPIHLQRKIKKGLFLLVTEAEEQAEMYPTSSPHSSTVMSASVSPTSNVTPIYTDLDQHAANYHEAPQQFSYQWVTEHVQHNGPNSLEK